MEISELYPVLVRPCHQHVAGHQNPVDRVPVDIPAVPVLIDLLAENHLHRIHILLLGQDQHVLTLLEQCVSVRNDDLALTPVILVRPAAEFPDPGHDQAQRNGIHYFPDGLPENGRVADSELGDEGLAVVLCRIVSASSEQQPKYYHTEDYSNDTEWIAHSAGHGHSVGFCQCRRVSLKERLLGGTEHWSIGDGAGEQTHGQVKGHISEPDEGEHRQQAHRDHCESQKVQLHPALLQRREETRTHLKSKRIDKENEAEILSEQEHLRINAEAEMASQDAGEEHESDSEGYTLEFQLITGKSRRTDERQDQYCLNETMLQQYICEPFHFRVGNYSASTFFTTSPWK